MSAAKSKKSDDKPQPPADKSTVVLLFAIAADTTWRMFVPTLGGAGLGLWADSVYDTEPMYAVGGLALGIIITAFLVRQQYKKGITSAK